MFLTSIPCYAPVTFLIQLHFTSGVNDVDLSIELASTALHIATGYYFDVYGEEYAQRVGFRHQGYLKPGGGLVMKIYEVGNTVRA